MGRPLIPDLVDRQGKVPLTIATRIQGRSRLASFLPRISHSQPPVDPSSLASPRQVREEVVCPLWFLVVGAADSSRAHTPNFFGLGLAGRPHPSANQGARNSPF